MGRELVCRLLFFWENFTQFLEILLLLTLLSSSTKSFIDLCELIFLLSHCLDRVYLSLSYYLKITIFSFCQVPLTWLLQMVVGLQ